MQDRNRRWFLKAAGATVATAAVAGCLGDDDDADWTDVREITLDGYADGWVGVEPSFIEDETNPTLVLQEGEEYTITWVNRDNVAHDLEIQNDEGDILYVTDTVETEGESASITFTATDEMVFYECSYHRGIQAGDIEVE